MSEFSDLINAGMAEMAAQVGTTITFNNETATVIPGEAQVSQELQDAGLWESGSCVVEMARTDFERLGLADRDRVTHAGRPMQLLVIGDDPADPWLRLHLRPAHDA